ncbi:MAG: hypothetical protein FWE37_06340 [Spirochaetaceae bacterium]|nr:hypothetical protein [Spirochaetaceae bacterium]
MTKLVRVAIIAAAAVVLVILLLITSLNSARRRNLYNSEQPDPFVMSIAEGFRNRLGQQRTQAQPQIQTEGSHTAEAGTRIVRDLEIDNLLAGIDSHLTAIRYSGLEAGQNLLDTLADRLYVDRALFNHIFYEAKVSASYEDFSHLYSHTAHEGLAGAVYQRTAAITQLINDLAQQY